MTCNSMYYEIEEVLSKYCVTNNLENKFQVVNSLINKIEHFCNFFSELPPEKKKENVNFFKAANKWISKIILLLEDADLDNYVPRLILILVYTLVSSRGFHSDLCLQRTILLFLKRLRWRGYNSNDLFELSLYKYFIFDDGLLETYSNSDFTSIVDTSKQQTIYIAIVLILDSEFNTLRHYNTAFLTEIIQFLYSSFSSLDSVLLVQKVIVLILKISMNIDFLSADLINILINTMNFSVDCIKYNEESWYYIINDYFFGIINKINSLGGTGDEVHDYTLFVLSTYIALDCGINIDESNVSVVCNMLQYVPINYVYEIIIKFFDSFYVFMRYYSIIELYLINTVDINLICSLGNQFEESQDCVRLFSLNRSMQEAGSIKNLISKIISSALNISDDACDLSEKLMLLNKILKTEEQLKTLLKVKHPNFNFTYEQIIPPSEIEMFVKEKLSNSINEEDYYNILCFIVKYQQVYYKVTNLNLDFILLSIWNLFDDSEVALRIGLKEKCFDFMLNYVLYLGDNIPLDVLSHSCKIMNACSKGDTKLSIKCFSLLMKYIVIEASKNHHEFTVYFQDYLKTEDMSGILLNEEFGKKLMCFVSDRCVVQRCHQWELKCVDCDLQSFIGQEPPNLNLSEYLVIIIEKYIECLTKDSTGQLINNVKRFLKHSPTIYIEKIFSLVFEKVDERNLFVDKVDFFICLPYFSPHGDLNYNIAFSVLNKILKSIFDFSNLELKKNINCILNIVDIFKRLVRVNNYIFLMPLLKILIILRISVQELEEALKEVMEKVTSFYGTLNTILIENEDDFSLFWMDIIIYFLDKCDLEIKFIITQIADIYGYTLNRFLQTRCVAFMIAHILLSLNKNQAKFIIYELADILYMEVNEFVDMHLHDIFPVIFFHDKEDDQRNAFNVLNDIVNNDLMSLIILHNKKLMGKMLLHMNKPVKIIRFLLSVYESIDEESCLQVLHENLIGTLAYVDCKLSANNTSRHMIKTCLKVPFYLTRVLKDCAFGEIRLKILSTLRSSFSIHYKTFPKLSLMAWMAFIYRIDLTTFGPYLSTVFLQLLNLFYKFPQEIGSIFHYLVVQNKKLFHEYLPSLYFVPDHVEKNMHEVWIVIQNALESFETPKDRLLNALKHIDCEHVDARIHAIRHLHIELKNNVMHLHELALKNDILDSIFKEVIEYLMKNLEYYYDDLKILCGQCLGELGAIDPSRFEIFYEQSNKYPYEIQSEDFAYFCINELIKELNKSENSSIINIVANCIQDILKIYFGSNEKKQLLQSFFGRFSNTDRMILEPLVTTRYIFKSRILKNKRHDHFSPIVIQNPLQWAYTWAKHLVLLLPEDFPRTVFTICLPTMKVNLHFSESILPYIILEALKTNPTTSMQDLEKGCKYVLGSDFGECLAVKPLSYSVKKRTAVTNTNKSTIFGFNKCFHMVFGILDFLYVALVDMENQCFSMKDERSNNMRFPLITSLKKFLQLFSLTALSWKSYMLKDYCRSLFYLEKYHDAEKDTILEPLKNVYTKLKDTDSLYGIYKSCKGKQSSAAMLLNDVVCGNLQDVVGVYERMAQKFSSSAHFKGLLQCYLNINQPFVALQVSKSFFHEKIFVDSSFYSEYVEALWNVGKNAEVSDMLSSFTSEVANSWSWSIDSLMIMEFIRNNKLGSARSKLFNVFSHLSHELSNIRNNSVGAYRQGYDIIVKLHISNEFEKFINIIDATCNDVGYDIEHEMKGFQETLSRRIELVRFFGGHVHDVVTFRKKMYGLASHVADKAGLKSVSLYYRKCLGQALVKVSSLERKTGNLQAAYTNLSIAEKFDVPEFFLEKAKLHHAKHETEAAITVLMNGIFELELCTPKKERDRILCAKAKLLVAKYNEQSMNVDLEENSANYLKAIGAYNLEKNYVYLAKYLYKLHVQETSTDLTASKSEIQLKAAQNFSKSLLYGCKYIYQSMSCLLSLWLDCEANSENIPYFKTIPTSEVSNAQLKFKMETIEKFQTLMENNIICLPAYMFMTCFSQLLSRLNHKSPYCIKLLKSIIVNIIIEFPQQSLWMVISHCKSSDVDHRNQMEKILYIVQHNKRVLCSLVRKFDVLADSLINACNKSIKVSKLVNITQISKNLVQILANKEDLVIVPSQKLRTIYLPNYKFCGYGLRKDHQPFPVNLVYLFGVKEKVQVLASIQQPKKLDFIGSDGKIYPLMCKPSDDLRLDSRILEFNSLVNMCLRRDPSSRVRNLLIRTYSVVPLNHECGIIEWLPNLKTFRLILIETYRKLKIPFMEMTKIKELSCKTNSLSSKLKLFEEVLLPQHPPVLHKWFFENFRKKDTWYLARRNFVQSLAVMSIVGYIVGLGDRHGENILIDTFSGDVVHVDFNCVFNKGEDFAFPEVVPFRLTHNLVSAMGPTGIEGVFIRCCEITNNVVRRNKDQLVSVIKPLLYYDSHFTSRNTSHKKTSSINELALEKILAVQKKLNGMVRTTKGYTKTLSVEGQVRCLISEATDNNNLCQMYFGWAPFL